MTSLVSVIIPVYNVEAELDICIGSMRKQTYTNLELIFIDDGSTDNSGRICDAFAAEAENVQVIHQQNGGQSSARNAGLDSCHGQWIFFLDSDDWIEPDCIERLVKAAETSGADIVACNYRLCREATDSVRVYSDCATDCTFSDVDAITHMWYGDILDVSIWGKLYRSSLWENVRLPDCFAEDTAMMHELIMQANQVYFLHSVLYNYRLRQGSLMRTFNERKYVLTELAARLLAFGEKHPETMAAAKCKAVDLYMHLVCRMPLNAATREKYKECVEGIKRHRKSILQDRKARKKTKAALWLSYLGMMPVRWLYRHL